MLDPALAAGDDDDRVDAWRVVAAPGLPSVTANRAKPSA